MFEQIKTILEPLNVGIYEDFEVQRKIPPANYIVFKEDVSPKVYADGKTLLKQWSCQLDVFETWENKKQLANAVENLLDSNGINHTRINVGYLSDLKKMQVTFEFNL